MIKYLTQDIVFAGTRGKAVQVKHCFLALGLHSLSNGKKMVDFIYKFVHCILFTQTCDMEIAQAEVFPQAAEETTQVLLMPKSSHNSIFTHFWVDNFGVQIEKMDGGG